MSEEVGRYVAGFIEGDFYPRKARVKHAIAFSAAYSRTEMPASRLSAIERGENPPPNGMENYCHVIGLRMVPCFADWSSRSTNRMSRFHQLLVFPEFDLALGYLPRYRLESRTALGLRELTKPTFFEVRSELKKGESSWPGVPAWSDVDHNSQAANRGGIRCTVVPRVSKSQT